MSEIYYIGWDVGAWNCDKNSKSRDALVILDNNASLIGKTWRGNLKVIINNSESTEDFITALLLHCGLRDTENKSVTMAIDAPLGFSDGLRNLLNGEFCDGIGTHDKNPYLFRKIEQLLFTEGFKPLSSIKDMIGSQTTKAMHAINKFAPNIESCGVWTDSTGRLKIIETYPSVCEKMQLSKVIDEKEKQDVKDALVCAEIAFIFGTNKERLSAPQAGISEKEGWIWVPKK